MRSPRRSDPTGGSPSCSSPDILEGSGETKRWATGSSRRQAMMILRPRKQCSPAEQQGESNGRFKGDVASTVRSFISKVKKRRKGVDLDASLYSEGIGLDSLDVAELSAVLEDEYGSIPSATGRCPKRSGTSWLSTTTGQWPPEQ